MYNRNYCGSLVIEINFLQKNITSGKKRNFKNVTDGYTRPLATSKGNEATTVFNNIIFNWINC